MAEQKQLALKEFESEIGPNSFKKKNKIP